LAAEVLRDRHGELHLAAREQALELVLVAHEGMDAEVAAGLHRREERARVLARVRRQRRRGQRLRVAVDGIAKEDELHHRDADDHPEGQAIALELDELLDDDPHPPRPGKHYWALSIRWMNTSSRPGCALRHLRSGAEN